MAAPAAALIAKAAIAALSDENGRKVIGGIIIAILSPIILIIVVIVSMLSATAEHNNAALKLSFEGGVISSQVPAEYRQHIENMQQSFTNLETVLAEIGSECEFEDGEPDFLRIRAVFYSLFFGSDFPQAHANRAFVDCFLTYETRTRPCTDSSHHDEDDDDCEEEYTVAIPIADLPIVYQSVGALIGRTITPEDAANITEIYYRVQSGDYSSRQPDSLEGGSNGTHAHIAELTAGDDTPFVGGNFASPIAGDWRSMVSCEFGTGYRKPSPPKPFKLPEAHTDMRRVFAYLIKERCIDREVIRHFAKEGTLFEDSKYHNAVFVGKDENGVAKHAHKRSTFTLGESYRGNVEGCDARCSFHHTGTSGRLYVFEAPVDMLSFLTLYPDRWQRHSHVALCGVSPLPTK